MALNWQDLSEIVFGYMLTKKLSPNSVNSEILCEPYPKGIQLLQSRKAPDEATLIDALGLQPYSAAVLATEKETVKPSQAVILLERAYARAEAAARLDKDLRRLRAGEDIDLSPIADLLEQMRKSETRIVKMDDVLIDETPLIPCGWEPIDEHIGGIPEIGVTVIAGPPSGGKTSLAAKLLSKWVKLHKKPAFYFSLELTNGQIVGRMLQVERLSKADRKLIYLCDTVEGVDDLCTLISKLENVSLVVIDFAELVIDGESGESVISAMYRRLLWTAKNLGIPIIVLSQMNRKYDGSVPMMSMVKWAGEQLARLVLLIYNTESVLVSPADAEILPPFPGEIYLVVGKTTFGKKHRGNGAIRIPFYDQTGWGDKSVKWHPIGSPPKKERYG